jgi:cytochrome d ubiquinol oxidase subunit I
MQTPAGHQVVDGVFEVVNWFDVVFNPSFPYRFTHMLLASALTCSFLMAGLSAWQMLKGVAESSSPKVLRVGLTVAALLIPVQILVGDAHGLNTLEHQPQKIAAIEGVWHTEHDAPLLLFAWPDAATQSNRFEVGIPDMASVILTHDRHGEIKGLNEFPGQHPPVAPMFWGFRVMVGMGMLMLAVSWAGWWLARRADWSVDRIPKRLLWVLTGMTFSGWVATVAGWYVTEIGRQPFIVYGLLRTADVAATNVTPPMIGMSLAMYLALYLGLILAYVGVLKYMAEKPEDLIEKDAPTQGQGRNAAALNEGSIA